MGPYKIKKVHNNTAYELDLPDHVKIHPVFHPWLLHLDERQPLQGQTQHEPGPVPIHENRDDGSSHQPTYEVAKIIDSMIAKGTDPLGNQAGILSYKVLWEGYPNEPTWEPYHHLVGSEEALGKFHSRYKRKPGPHLRWMELPNAKEVIVQREKAKRGRK